MWHSRFSQRCLWWQRHPLRHLLPERPSPSCPWSLVGLKYYCILWNKNFNRQYAHTCSVKNILNARANEKWCAADKFQESQSVMVSKLFDPGKPSPSLEEEIKPVIHSDNPVMNPIAFFRTLPFNYHIEHYQMDIGPPSPVHQNCKCNEDMYCQPVCQESPPTSIQNWECPALNVWTNLVWRDKAHPHHCAMVLQTPQWSLLNTDWWQYQKMIATSYLI